MGYTSVIITGRSLSLIDGAIINLSSFGQGDAGNITVQVSDTISLSGRAGGLPSSMGTSVIATPELPSTGNSGNINLTARQITLSDGASIGSGNPLAAGDTGNIQINVEDSLQLSQRSRISSSTQGQGGAGGITIVAGDRVSLTGGSQIQTDTFSAGNAGNLFIQANRGLFVDGFDQNGSVSQISSIVGPTGIPIDNERRGGNITVISDSLSFTNGGQIRSSTLGTGSAGDISVNAQGKVLFDGSSDFGFPSGIFSNVELDAVGDGGAIDITAGSMSFTEGAQISSGTSGQGNAGNIRVDVRNGNVLFDDRSGFDLPSGIFSSVEPNAVGNGGTIDVSAGSLSITNRAQFSSTTSGRGNAGDIVIQANDRAYLLNSIVISEVSDVGGIGDGGNITLTVAAGSLEMRDGSALLADTENRGNAGNITINVRDAIILAGQGASAADITDIVSNQITSTVDFSGTAVGEAGEIRITANRLLMSDAAFISSETFGQGNAGDLFINADDIQLSGSSLITSAVRREGRGSGGDIAIESRSINLSDGSRINAFVERQQRDSQGNILQGGQGRGGNLRINSTEAITLSGADQNSFSSGLFTLTERGAQGEAGNIFITTGNLQILDGAIVVASTYNPSPGGDISINASEIDLTGGGQIVTSTRDRGNAGDIRLNITDSVALSGFDPDFANRQQRVEQFISTSNGRFEQVGDIITNEGGNSGIFANTISGSSGAGGTITLDANTLTLGNQAEISAATSGSGSAGDVAIRNADRILLDNAAITTAINPGAVLSDPTTARGNIDIQTNQLRLDNGSNITASTSGQGNAGDIAVRNAGAIELNNSRITSTVNVGAIGDGGSINLQTNLLQLNRANITASTNGQGRAGDVTVRGADQVSLSRSNISTEVGETGNGRGGNINIRTNLLNLNHSRISSSTENVGDTGNVDITASERINLRNRSRISNRVAAGATGDSRTIRITTPQLRLNNSRVTASTNGRGRAGNIIVNANSLAATNGGRLVSSTNRNRPAGTIILRDLDSLSLSGRNSNGRASGIFANTARGGRGGTINLETQTLHLNDDAAIATTSRGRGRAGNIKITASEQLQANNGHITTQSSRADGGNIEIIGGDINLLQGSDIRTDVEHGAGNGGDISVNASEIRLRNDSDIQTRVGTDGAGDGGRIDINADSVIAYDDSDIITESPQRGGDINLNTPVFFGAGYEADSASGNADGNGRVDLDASGEVSSGTVQTPNTDFIQNSLSDLPTNAINTDQLLANSCIARTETGGTFLITGTGGLPAAPGNDATSDYPTGEIRAIPSEADPDRPWQLGDPIVEPQGVYRLPDGRLVMSRECESAAAQ